MVRYAKGYFFTRDILKWTASLYAADSDPQNAEISPLFGQAVSEMAPAHFIVAECDVLRDQAFAYAQALREAGVTVQCHYYHGVPHAFVAMAGALDLGKQALQGSKESLKTAFSIENKS